MATAAVRDHCGRPFMGRSGWQRFCSPEHRELARQTPGSEFYRRHNANRAAHPCLVPGCPHPRHVTPAGEASSRCREHTAEAARDRYARRRGGTVRPYRFRSVGYEALVRAVERTRDAHAR